MNVIALVVLKTLQRLACSTGSEGSGEEGMQVSWKHGGNKTQERKERNGPSSFGRSLGAAAACTFFSVLRGTEE